MRKRKKSRKSQVGKLFQKTTLGGFIAALVWLLAQLINNFHPAQPATMPGVNAAVQLYSNQTEDDLVALYKQAIDGAQRSITLVIYALTDKPVIEALQKKCEAGVAVHIVCDAKASRGVGNQLPKATIIKRVGEGLTHQKILIIDQREIWLGSANLTFSSLNVHGNLVMGIHHPLLAQAMSERLKSMDDEGGFTPLLQHVTRAGPQQVELWMLPDNTDAAKRVIELIRGAKKCIKVAMFTWTRLDFTQELIAAAKRGIKVEAVLDRYAGLGASSKVVNLLKAEGIPVRLSTGKGLLHHKFAIIDDHTLINGSANWTNAAFKDNDDCFLVVHPLTDEQNTKLKRLYEVIQKQSAKPENARSVTH